MYFCTNRIIKYAQYLAGNKSLPVVLHGTTYICQFSYQKGIFDPRRSKWSTLCKYMPSILRYVNTAWNSWYWILQFNCCAGISDYFYNRVTKVQTHSWFPLSVLAVAIKAILIWATFYHDLNVDKMIWAPHISKCRRLVFHFSSSDSLSWRVDFSHLCSVTVFAGAWLPKTFACVCRFSLHGRLEGSTFLFWWTWFPPVRRSYWAQWQKRMLAMLVNASRLPKVWKIIIFRKISNIRHMWTFRCIIFPFYYDLGESNAYKLYIPGNQRWPLRNKTYLTRVRVSQNSCLSDDVVKNKTDNSCIPLVLYCFIRWAFCIW